MSCDNWSPLAVDYNPIQIGSIDGTDASPHDRALVRAMKSKYKPNHKLKNDPKCTLFVTRFDVNTNEETIEKFFSKYGSIVSMRLVRDIVTGFSKRYAFIEYKDQRTAQKVYQKANNAVIDGRKILVDFECERTMSGWKPRRLGGGFGGKKESGQLRFGCRDRPWKRPIRLGMSYGDRDRDDAHSSQLHKDYEHYKDRRVESSESRKESSHHHSHHHNRHHNHRYYNKKKNK